VKLKQTHKAKSFWLPMHDSDNDLTLSKCLL